MKKKHYKERACGIRHFGSGDGSGGVEVAMHNTNGVVYQIVWTELISIISIISFRLWGRSHVLC